MWGKELGRERRHRNPALVAGRGFAVEPLLPAVREQNDHDAAAELDRRTHRFVQLPAQTGPDDHPVNH